MIRIYKIAVSTAVFSLFITLVESQLSAQLRYRNPKLRDQWTEEDWQGYENYRFRELLTDINRSPALRVELEISEEQRLVAKAAQDKLMPELQALSEKSAPDYQLYRQGKFPEYPKYEAEFRAKVQKVFENEPATVEKALLPHQIKRLRQLAKLDRLRAEKKPSSEFEIVPLLGEEFGLTKAEQKRLADVAAKANLEFYEQLVKQREKATKKVFQTLSKQNRDKFEEVFGEPYDVNAESLQEAREKVKEGGSKQ